MTRTAISPRFAINSFFSMPITYLICGDRQLMESVRTTVRVVLRKNATSTSMCASLRPSMASEIFRRTTLTAALPLSLCLSAQLVLNSVYLLSLFSALGPLWLTLLHERHGAFQAFRAPDGRGEFLGSVIQQTGHGFVAHPVQQGFGFCGGIWGAKANAFQCLVQHVA